MHKNVKLTLWAVSAPALLLTGYLSVVLVQALSRDPDLLEPPMLEGKPALSKLHNAFVDLVALRLRQGMWSFPVALAADYRGDVFTTVAAMPAPRTVHHLGVTCSAEGDAPVVVATLTKGAWLPAEFYGGEGFGDSEEELREFAKGHNAYATYTSVDGGTTGFTLALDDQDWKKMLELKKQPSGFPHPQRRTRPCHELEPDQVPGWLKSFPISGADSAGGAEHVLIAPSGKKWPVVKGRGVMKAGLLDSSEKRSGYVVTGSAAELEQLLAELKADVDKADGSPWLEMNFTKVRQDWGPEPRTMRVVVYNLSDGSSRLMILLAAPNGAQLALAGSAAKSVQPGNK